VIEEIRPQLEHLRQHGVLGHRVRRVLGEQEDPQPAEQLRGRQVLEQPVLPAPVGRVGLRHDVRRRALEDCDVLRVLAQLGHELDRAGPGPDDGDALAGQLDVVVPARRVERVAGEALPARDVGQHRPRQLADGGHEDGGLVRLATVGLDAPDTALLVERGPGDLGPVPDVRLEPVLRDDAPQVGQDVRLVGEPLRPARVRLERVRIERRRDVARGTGVGVVPPDAAGLGRALQDREVGEPGALQLDRRPDTAEPGAHDQHRRPLRRTTHAKKLRSGSL
jgi:hypothetical protein